MPVFTLNKFIQGNTYGVLGEIYLNKAEFAEAKNYIKKAADIADETHTLLQQYLNYQNITRVYIKENNSKDAYKSFNVFMGLNDSLLNSTNITTTALSAFIEDKMKSQQSLFNSKIESSEKNKKIWIFFIAGIAVVLIAAILIYIKFQQNKTALHSKNLQQKALRAQLNPHFIFNAMQSIQREYAVDAKKGEGMLVDFSALIREVLNKSFVSEVMLEEEIGLIKKYVSLESQHSASILNLTINVDKAINTSIIVFPSLALQPLIENAVKYGATHNNIIVNISKRNKLLVVHIENDLLQTFLNNEAKERSGTGLQLTKERIDLFNKKHKTKGGLRFEKDKDKFIAVLSIAYIINKQPELT